jgi:hypothetical protein
MNKDGEILQKIELLRSKLDDVNGILSDLFEEGMFVVVAYNERQKIESPVLEIKNAILHIDYLKD